jgi:hypothetical protein
VLVVGALTACGSEARHFIGDYDVTDASSLCLQDGRAAPGATARYGVGARSIDENSDGTVSLDLPMPPCPIRGVRRGSELSLTAESCVIEIEASSTFEAHTVEYYDGTGVALWEDEDVSVTTETRRRYTASSEDFPEWFETPWSCTARYTLQPR